MGLVQRLLHREAPPQTPCPRCGIPAPGDADVCAACGWDLSDGYRSEAVGAPPPATATEEAEPRP